MLSSESYKYWFPIDEIIDFISSKIPSGSRVLEIGPGAVPFNKATHFIDTSYYMDKIPPDFSKKNVIIYDAQNGIPFPDKYFDFIYCRHVLEDLNNPFHLMNEMSRVSEAGYIETPSVRAEICRGVDGKEAPWRGYCHHNWLVCNRDGVLKFLRKTPVIEYLLDFDEESNERVLLKRPLHWNSYYEWRGDVKWEHLELKPASSGYLDEVYMMFESGTVNSNNYEDMLARHLKYL